MADKSRNLEQNACFNVPLSSKAYVDISCVKSENRRGTSLWLEVEPNLQDSTKYGHSDW